MVNDAFRGYVRSIIIALALQIYSFGNESCISIKCTNFLLGYFPKVVSCYQTNCYIHKRLCTKQCKFIPNCIPMCRVLLQTKQSVTNSERFKWQFWNVATLYLKIKNCLQFSLCELLDLRDCFKISYLRWLNILQ